MKLVVGLGNPGAGYAQNRHNLGFRFIDTLMASQGLTPPVNKFNCQLTSWLSGDEKILLAKPQTFMNNSGLPTSELLHYYKLTAADLLVVHDDLDLAFLDLRYKVGGSSAGHRGLNSLDNFIGTNYQRLRFGIGRPLHKEQVHAYVLQNFLASEEPKLSALLQAATDNLAQLLSGDPQGYLQAVKKETEAV